MNWHDWLILAVLILNLGLLLALLKRQPSSAAGGDTESLQGVVATNSERLERELREEVARSGIGTRQEIGQVLAAFQQMLLTQSGDVARTQNEQIDSFRTQLTTMHAAVGQALQTSATTLATQAHASREAQDLALKRFSDSVVEQLRALADGNERRLGEVKTAVEQRLAALQQGNEQ